MAGSVSDDAAHHPPPVAAAGGGRLRPAALNLKVPRSVADAIAGAVAGAAARAIISPLDVIKIRFQVQIEPTMKWRSTQTVIAASSGELSAAAVQASFRPSKYTGMLQATKEILREEGIKGLWRGTVPGLLLVVPYTAIQFVVIQKFYEAVAKREGRVSPAMHFVGGSVAGMAATVGSYPFDLLRTVMASQGEPKIYASMQEALVKIYRSKGVAGLYAGLGPTLVEIIPYAGLQFGLYNTCQRWTHAYNRRRSASSSSASTEWEQQQQQQQAEKLGAFQQFMCGLAAGTMAKLICHPLDVVKKRFQVEGLARHPKYGARVEHVLPSSAGVDRPMRAVLGMAVAMRHIIEMEGWHGLFKGTLPSVIKAAPNAAVTFAVYEAVSKWLQQYVDDENSL